MTTKMCRRHRQTSLGNVLRGVIRKNALKGTFEASEQCDQIWRNFDTLGTILKSWENVEALFSIRQNFNPTFKNIMLLGKVCIVVDDILF